MFLGDRRPWLGLGVIVRVNGNDTVAEVCAVASAV